MEETNQTLAKDTESLKLIKNTKGYNWEIKILSTDLDRLQKINDQFIERFGNTIGENKDGFS